MNSDVPLIQIARGLFLGNEFHAASRLLLIENNVHYVINAAGNQVSNHFADFNFQYLPLDLYDTTEDDIHQYFASTFEFLEKSQLDGRACLVHCKSGKSRSAVIIMAYLMRKYQAPLKEVYRLLLLLTGGDLKPNPAFLAQLMDYEVEILGKSSFDEKSGVEEDTEPVLTGQRLGHFVASQGDLESEEGEIAMYKKLKSLIILKKWSEVAKLSEEMRTEDFEPFPLFQCVLRRALYHAVCMQLNFVVEKAPTPTHPTTLLIHTYIEQTQKAICDFIPTNSDSGYLSVFEHALSYTLSVSNVGVGSIFIDHLNQKLGAAYRSLHAGKLPQGLNLKPSDEKSKPIDEKEALMDALLNDLRENARIVFHLFRYLSADPSLVSYLEQYENALAQRLSLFLPIVGSATHALMTVEDEISALIPHSAHVEKVRRILSDILRAPDLNSSWRASLMDDPSDEMASNASKLEVAILDTSCWPMGAFTKPYDGKQVPTTILPTEVFPMWKSFKQFATKDPQCQLVLVPHLGDAQLTAQFGSKQYVFDVTTPMMLVLTCFNDNAGEVLTFSQLQSQLNLTPKLLAQTLFSLSQPSHPLLNRNTATTQTIIDTDSFSLNESFSFKTRRVKIPNVKYPPETK